MTFYCNQKRDYVLNPRGKALYDGRCIFDTQQNVVFIYWAFFNHHTDSSSFGSKMLAKMGWSKGKGLGANLNGNQEFVKVTHKGDQKGLGFHERDDQWTQHEDNFNSLLKSFDTNKKSSSSSSSDDDAERPVRAGFGGAGVDVVKRKATDLFSGVSLEEQSQKSRARVHYRKFTRGKDMTRYSERDLANIFGKKALDDKHARQAPDAAAKTAAATEESVAAADELQFGVQTIETGTSVGDYFRAKMEAKLAARKGPNGDGGNPFYVHKEAVTTTDNGDDEQTETKSKKKKKKKKSKTEEMEIEVVVEEQQPKKKSKKKSTESQDPENSNIEIPNVTVVGDDGDAELKIKKKKKRKAEDAPPPPVNVDAEPTESKNATDEVAAKKRRKKDKKKEVIHSKPIHFPILLSNVLNSLYDSAQDALTTSSSSTTATKPTPATTTTPSTANSADIVDIFELAKYKAEIFRFLDLNGFDGAANLCDISGYGYSQNLQLRIVDGFRDDQRISNFWDQALVNKYGNDVITIKKEKKKHKYDIHRLQKRNVFKF